LTQFDPVLIARATHYLYTKETKSSYAIERETPDQQRAARFVELLRGPHTHERITKERLLELQNSIVDHRYEDADYRAEQNYVGVSIGPREQIHYVCPRPEDVCSLMAGLLDTHARVVSGEVDPVVAAAVVAFEFVYIHPFRDGNGRLHRFLIHDILSALGFTPPGVILPVSATILSNERAYDACLELLSRPLSALVSYSLDQEGGMRVEGETADLYRYPDLTGAAEYLYRTLAQTVQEDFLGELNFLRRYDVAKRKLRGVLDMPEVDLNRFLTFTTQNRGRLAKGKRKTYFASLTDEEVESLEAIVEEVFFDEAGQSSHPHLEQPKGRDLP
jgi:hypothetical protein